MMMHGLANVKSTFYPSINHDLRECILSSWWLMLANEPSASEQYPRLVTAFQP
jgi:hypothetical protein